MFHDIVNIFTGEVHNLQNNNIGEKALMRMISNYIIKYDSGEKCFFISNYNANRFLNNKDLNNLIISIKTDPKRHIYNIIMDNESKITHSSDIFINVNNNFLIIINNKDDIIFNVIGNDRLIVPYAKINVKYIYNSSIITTNYKGVLLDK